MTHLNVEDLENMSAAEEKAFWKAFEKELANDDGAAAKAHLAAGRPIYYCDDRYEDGCVREWPDGRLELVTIDENDEIQVIRTL